MRYRFLGLSGFSVSVLSFGAWQMGDEAFWGESADADAQRSVDMALDAGINLFDTAEMYGGGESERLLGQCLGKRRADVLVASKVSLENCPPKQLGESLENSLKRLNTDWIDLYQVHWPPRDVPFAEVYGELARLREEGKIRAIGLSNFGPLDLRDWHDVGDAVSNQIGYNALFRAAEYEAVPASRDYELGILAYMPLMQGLLTGRYRRIMGMSSMRRRTRHFSGIRPGVRHGEDGHEQLMMATVTELREFAEAVGLAPAVLALAWTVAQPGISSVILGSRNPAQLRSNLTAADLDIGPAAVAQLDEITFPLKQAMGFNCDMWETSSSSRIR
jgi:aryl-alcohol dehydrogenase-like predicted oxidoreductase